MKQYNYKPMYASFIVVDGKPIKFFIDEVSTQRGGVVIDDKNFIKTVALNNVNEVLNFLNTLELEWGAQEIEI